ncbi:Sucrase/ferredoxin-like-domain-containing protein [Globomyces pollinis-pini]|nr:Sucrase/ferredoxin-like-domain-containing protein [Globomyces pollinis-pini]
MTLRLSRSIQNLRESMGRLFSSSSNSTSIPEVTVDSTAHHIVFTTEDDCLSCPNPCESHEQLPGYLQKKIDTSNLYNSFKPYTQHLILKGGTGSTWLQSIEESKDSYFEKADAILSKSTSGRILLTAYEDESQYTNPTPIDDTSGLSEDSQTESSSPENSQKDTSTSAILFPKGLYFPKLNYEEVEQLANWIIDPSTECPVESVPVTSKAYILVCTHKRRDKRCGVAGPMLVKEFSKEADNLGMKDSISLFGVSHFGGHKFAGNIIVYHQDKRGVWVGDWYGRIKTCHAKPVLQCAIKDEKVIQDLWRGRMNADKSDPGLDW